MHEADLGDETFDTPIAAGLDARIRGVSLTSDTDDDTLAVPTGSPTACTSTSADIYYPVAHRVTASARNLRAGQIIGPRPGARHRHAHNDAATTAHSPRRRTPIAQRAVRRTPRGLTSCDPPGTTAKWRVTTRAVAGEGADHVWTLTDVAALVDERGIIGFVSALDELAVFVADYCEARAETLGASAVRAVLLIITAAALPGVLDRQAALYGFAAEIGAVRAPGFNPTWKPTGCH